MMYGNHITEMNDPLTATTVEHIFRTLVKPPAERMVFLDRLETVSQIDRNKYNNLKKRLPYVVCARFHPAIRRKEHFASIRHFILDIDHLDSKGMTTDELKEKIRLDSRVHLAFNSPSGTGMKVLFRLAEPCHDANVYSLFYKAFSRKWGEQQGIADVVDLRTFDVSRACFLGRDARAYFNDEPAEINIKDYFDPDIPGAAHAIRTSHSESIKMAEEERKAEKKENGPANEVLDRIKQRLNPDFRPVKPPPYVPAELDLKLSAIEKKLLAYDIRLTETRPISYGRALHVQAGGAWAEVNLFYGKKGFSIVPTTKTHSSRELALATQQILHELLVLGIDEEPHGSAAENES